jgi:prealbumin domain-containing protein
MLRFQSRPTWRRRAALTIAIAAGLGLLGASQLAVSATTIPSGYFVVNDQQGANDVPGQVDLTRMGRDDTDSTKYKIFMSWDSTDQWTGTGQTGDACALFDKDATGNGGIDFVVCGQITNPGADPAVVAHTATSPFAFNCNNKKVDRCGNPAPVGFTWGNQITSGPLGAAPFTSANRFGNLITDTDPFFSPSNPVGTNYPNDSSLELVIAKGFLPSGARLVNVCSYPSAGNGGNNNPFDCITTPGGGFLNIVKNTGSATTSTFSFAITPDLASGSSSASVAGTSVPSGGTEAIGDTGALGIAITNIATITETQPSSDWVLSSVSCVKQGGGTTGSPDLAHNKITAISIESGQTTTCTFTDRTQPKLSLKKIVVNDAGGTNHADDWTLTATPTTGSAISGKGTLDAGTTADDAVYGPATASAGVAYTLSESGPTGYSQVGDWSCTGTGVHQGTGADINKVTLDLGASGTCTANNGDNGPELSLKKVVVNDNGGTTHANAWTLTATPTTGSAISGQGTLDAGTTADDAVYGPNAAVAGMKYTLGESGPTGYSQVGDWSCTGTGVHQGTGADINTVTLDLGASGTCTVNNGDDKASPTGATTQSWKIWDSLTITGLRTGAPDAAAATVRFELFSDATCTAANQVGSVTVTGVTSSVVAIPSASGIAIASPGTYYWRVAYSGDQYNTGITKACGSETTTISRTE